MFKAHANCIIHESLVWEWSRNPLWTGAKSSIFNAVSQPVYFKEPPVLMQQEIHSYSACYLLIGTILIDIRR